MRHAIPPRRVGRRRRRASIPATSTDGAHTVPAPRSTTSEVSMGYIIRQPLSSMCSPFHFLVYAVFQQLVVDIISLRGTWIGETIGTPSEALVCRRYDKIKRYLLSDDANPFSFSFLCHHLGFDDHHIRTALCRLLDKAFAGGRVRHRFVRTVVVQERRRKRI